MIEKVYIQENDIPNFSDGRVIANCLITEGKVENISKAAIGKIGDDINTWDLFFIDAVLVTAGLPNKNSDFFSSKQIVAAKDSPKYKPINFMHNQKDIIGTIIDSVPVDDNYIVVSEEVLESPPEKMHLIMKGAIYRVWEDQEKQEAVTKLIQEIQEGKWAVSMECLFKNFAYVLKSSKGEYTVLERNHNTAFLTKHLRQYGGSGKYGDYAISRALLDVTFSAVGIVNQPANPESVILNDDKAVALNSVGYINLDTILTGGISMAETIVSVENDPAYKLLKASYDELKAKADKSTAEKDAEFEKLKKEKAEKDAELEDMKKAKCEMDENLEKAKKEKAEKDAELEKAKTDQGVKNDQFAEAQKEIASLKAELDAEKKTREAYEAASRRDARVKALKDVNPSMVIAEIDKVLADTKDLNDKTFAAMVSHFKTFKSAAPKELSATASEVVENPVEVEPTANMGTVVEDSFKKTTAQIKEWAKSSVSKPKGEK